MTELVKTWELIPFPQGNMNVYICRQSRETTIPREMFGGDMYLAIVDDEHTNLGGERDMS